MEAHKSLLIFGQVVSIIGTLGLARWGIPQTAYDTTGEQPMIASTIDDDAKEAGTAGLKRHTRQARAFLIILAVGMGLQLVATVLSP